MSLAIEHNQDRHSPLSARIRQMEGRDWWLWLYVVLVTIALTVGLGSFAIIGIDQSRESVYWTDLREWVRGLAALVLLFDIYTVYQHLRLSRMRRLLAEQNHLFRLISENAADMITVVNEEGHSLYDSPACEKVLGYSLPELSRISMLELVHPDDRARVSSAAQAARVTGQGQRLEYRMAHQDGSWRILDSSMSVVRDNQGETDRLVIVNRDITENRLAQEKLEYNSLHDALTGLPNRSLLMRKLQRELVRAGRHDDYKFALLHIDIDEFKVVNDSLGPAAGDEFLIQIGRRIAFSLRGFETGASRSETQPEHPTSEDILAKLPGDEFAVLLDDIRDPSDGLRVCERIQKNLALPFNIAGQEVVITASIGIAMADSGGSQPADLLRNAEIAMHRAKNAGKSHSEVFDSAMHESAVHRLQLESELRKGIERNEFRVAYQPVYALDTGLVTGFEALSRWHKPEGVVMPGGFVEVADLTGLMEVINRSLMHEAFCQLREWQEFCSRPLTMSVNVTQHQFAKSNLTSDIAKILDDTGVDPAAVELEIVETVAMSTTDPQHNLLNELKNLGVRLGIDDFGTGYSSLARLQQLPVDTLKIDRQFISLIDSSQSTREIVNVIVMLAHSRGLKVVAEGVETEEQVRYLRNIGCDMAQGYFYSKPIDPAFIPDLLKPYAAMAHR